MNKKNITLLITYPNPYDDKSNTRLHQTITSLLKFNLFNKIDFFCVQDSSRGKNINHNNLKIKKIRLIKHKKNNIGKEIFYLRFIRSGLWIINIIIHSLFKKYSIVTYFGPIDLITIPFFKFIKKSKIIYFSGDLVSNNNSDNKIEFIYKNIERYFLKYCDQIFVVNDGMKQYFQNEYNIKNNIEIIWNAPYQFKLNKNNIFSLRKKLNIHEESVIFGYVGYLSAKGRSLNNLIKVFSKLSTKKQLIIAGYGQLEKKMNIINKKYKNIHYIGVLNWSDIQYFIREIDVGLVLLENISLNYYYALPTKLFQYLSCSKPVVSSNFPTMGGLVKKYDCGWPIKPNYKQIYKTINNISKKDVIEKNKKINAIKYLFTWEIQEKKILKIFHSFLEK